MSFKGNWKFVKGENVEKFMLAAGAQAEKAKIAENATTTVSCDRNGDNFSIIITGEKGNTIEQKFQPGVPFTETFAVFGKERQAVASVEGNTVTIKGVEPGTVVETREVNGDEMVFSMSKPGVDIVAKRYFQRA
ncbi:fatty acid-binding protein 2-like [Saccoglossus kowalevskii]|uniref:Fatty acid-binding protein, liver-like n=1 Tax=Saccoglossus kowalevskii TaxID=10224 RepID=A0ABM0MBY1_SACKO|nr:PREDICTED: fatty acid-binding protein, liver-like [Saccoglossus kowalevskii]